MTSLIAFETSVNVTLCGKRTIMGQTFTYSGYIDRWTKVQTKYFTLPLASLITLNKLPNSFQPPLKKLYEDKEVNSFLFISSLFVIKIKLSLKINCLTIKLYIIKIIYLLPFFDISFKILLFTYAWICHFLAKHSTIDNCIKNAIINLM